MKVTALYAGKPQPLGPRGNPSSIVKQPISALSVNVDGTDEDQQANLKLHGGPEKVLHQFSLSSYTTILDSYPELAEQAIAGSIGENITVPDMTDENVMIGDVYRFGEVVLQVSAPRAPCVKISQRFDTKNLDRLLGNEGHTGWYYRVLETGKIKVDDEVTLVSRPEKSVSVHHLMRAVYNADYFADAAEYIELAPLDDEWREKCVRATKRANKS